MSEATKLVVGTVVLSLVIGLALAANLILV